MCESNSQRYTFLFIDQFANTVFLKSAIWYFLAQWSLRWQRKYPQIKTGQKLSEKLICDAWLPLTEFQLYFMELFASLISVESDNWYFGSIWRLYGQRKYPPMKIRKKFSEKLLCVLSIHLTELQLSPQEAFSSNCTCGICKVRYGSPWMALVKREISSDENWKEAFWETALCSVNSSHGVTAFPYGSRSLRLFLWKLQRDIWKPIEAYGEKENILRWKLERRFLRNWFVMWEFHSLIYSFISCRCWLALFLWNLRTDISDPFEDYRAEGNIFR